MLMDLAAELSENNLTWIYQLSYDVFKTQIAVKRIDLIQN